MNLSSIVATQVQASQFSQNAGASSSAINKAFARSNDRIGQQLQSTNVQLSSYGQIKSSFAGLQGAATALGDAAASKTATSADLKKAVQGFVDSYNQAAKSVAGIKTGALADNGRARLAANDLSRSLTAGNGLGDLRQLGISRGKDGSLSIDTKALDQALQTNADKVKGAMADLGRQVGTTMSRELASRGNVGAGVASLTDKVKVLTQQQTTQQQQSAAVLQAIGEQTNQLNYSAAGAVTAYRSLQNIQGIFGG